MLPGSPSKRSTVLQTANMKSAAKRGTTSLFERINKSSAYIRHLISTLLSWITSRLSLKMFSRSYKNVLNKLGLKLQHCLTPTSDWKFCVSPPLTRTQRFTLLYILEINERNFLLSLHFINLYNKPFLQTESYAFLKSTKQAYTYLLSLKNRFRIAFSINI